jgi:hypothetical protein
LQAFKDYAFDRRSFTGTEIRAQIKAAEDFGSLGWMLWNPRNIYAADGLRQEHDGAFAPESRAVPLAENLPEVIESSSEFVCY